MTPRRVHGAVLVLFALAGIFYATQWFDAALWLGLIGVVFEISAWITWIVTDSKQESGE